MDELMDYLDMVVPLRILEYQRNGIDEETKTLVIAEYLEFIEIPSNVDRSVRKAISESSLATDGKLYAKLADALAILSFQDGGVKFGRSRYKASYLS